MCDAAADAAAAAAAAAVLADNRTNQKLTA
jgi:hypothetical protein